MGDSPCEVVTIYATRKSEGVESGIELAAFPVHQLSLDRNGDGVGVSSVKALHFATIEVAEVGDL